MQRKNQTEFKAFLIPVLCFASEWGCEGYAETSTPWSGSAVQGPWLYCSCLTVFNMTHLYLRSASHQPAISPWSYLTGQTFEAGTSPRRLTLLSRPLFLSSTTFTCCIGCYSLLRIAGMLCLFPQQPNLMGEVVRGQQGSWHKGKQLGTMDALLKTNIAEIFTNTIV